MKLGVSGTGPYCPYGCPNLSQDDYLSVVIEPRLRQKQVTDKLITGVITDVAQVRVQEIITTTQDGANALLTQLDNGADFSDVAGSQASTGFATDGLVDWFTQDATTVDQAVRDAAFSTDVDKYSKVITATTGQFYIVKVLQRDDHRPLSTTQLDAKEAAVISGLVYEGEISSDYIPVDLPGSDADPTASCAADDRAVQRHAHRRHRCYFPNGNTTPSAQRATDSTPPAVATPPEATASSTP